MKILLYGSSYISEQVANHLLAAGREIVGHVPSSRSTFPGKMPVPAVSPDTAHDVLFSVQYDKRLPVHPNSFNLHTGLLPEYGGCNVLSHTILNGAKEQGMTFHRIAETFDAGEIISKISYPVHEGDTVANLYARMALIAGPFADLCLSMIHWKGHEMHPTMYRRADLPPDISERDVQIIRAILPS